jgi:hypothetical protein
MSDYYCPKCKRLWLFIDKKKGSFRVGGFIPYTSDTKTELCPACKNPEKYRFEIARCSECNKPYFQEIMGDQLYCRSCIRKKRKEGERNER